MSDEIIVALVGFVGVVITGIITLIVTSYKRRRSFEAAVLKRLREIERSVHMQGVKVDTLWAIYAEDAIRDARKSEMIAERSTEAPTRKWRDATTKEFRDKIKDLIDELPNGIDSREMAIEVTSKLGQEILLMSASADISASVIFGTIYSMCAKSRKWLLENDTDG